MRTPIYSRCRPVGPLALLVAWLACGGSAAGAATVRPAPSPTVYPDGRPAARYRLDVQDYGPVLRHGGGPDHCDELGARDVWVWEHGGTYFMLYDGNTAEQMPAGVKRHMNRDVGLAWLELPLVAPTTR